MKRIEAVKQWLRKYLHIRIIRFTPNENIQSRNFSQPSISIKLPLNITMKLFKSLFFFTASFQLTFANEDLVRGMKGLQEAAKDPELLKQLMADLNNPETMSEAKKMMENPGWKQEMRNLNKIEEYQQTFKNTEDIIKDPNTQIKLEEAIKLHEQQGDLEQSIGAAMGEAMKLMNNPDAMKEAQKMMQDKNLQKSMKEFFGSNSGKAYLGSMKSYLEREDTKEAFAKLEYDFHKL